MHFPKFALMKLTVLSDRIFLYIGIELSKSIEVIGAYFIIPDYQRF